MSRRCQLTGKSNSSANTVSHSNRRAKRLQKANIFNKRIYVPSKGQWVTVKVSTHAMRIIDKVGIDRFLMEQGIKL